MPPEIGILHRIAQKIYKDLIEPELVTIEPVMKKGDILPKCNILLIHLGIHDRVYILHHIRNAALVYNKFHLAALNLGHIQDIVEYTQKVSGRTVYLLQTFDTLVLSLVRTQCHLSHSDYSIHRRSDLM